METWGVTFYSSGATPLTEGVIYLELYSESSTSTNAVKYPVKGKDGQQVVLKRFDKEVWTSLDGKDVGNSYTGQLPEVPGGLVPAVLRLKLQPSLNGPKKLYINRVVLVPPGQSSGLLFPTNSWLDTKQSWRVFFDAKARLPGAVHANSLLANFRKEELSSLRGPVADNSERQEQDRIYVYDVYNDLGGKAPANGLLGAVTSFIGGLLAVPRVLIWALTLGQVKLGGSPADLTRPTLGGSSTLPYPRRIRTGRPVVNGAEQHSNNPWLPLDDRFDDKKEANFQRSQLAAISLVQFILEGNLRNDFLAKRFSSFEDYRSLFKRDDAKAVKPVKPVQREDVIRALWRMDSEEREGIMKACGVAKDVRDTIDKKQIPIKAFSEKQDDLDRLANAVDDLLAFSIPQIVAGQRGDWAWEDDAELGREVLAGQHPMKIRAVNDSNPLPKGSFSEADLVGVNGMDGKSLLDLISANRVFLVDLHDIIIDYATKVNAMKDHFLYGARALFVLQNPGQIGEYLLPVAVALTPPRGNTTVYTPNDGQNVWVMAKTVFSSVDSGYHQLVSHWLNTHASVEPYLIATRRQLSALHPVYKLLMPHFRFTMNINANARGTLISANGVIESNFTPGKYSMELSSVVYGALWNFEKQAVPKDLESRGMARLNPQTGAIESMLLKDYPYADDARLIWEALEGWVKGYLNVYYKSDADVIADSELNEWWREIREEGHADKKNAPGWPELNGIKNLVFILTTIMWTASGEHAAVNFGQYDYSGFVPNRPSIIRVPLPDDKKSRKFQDLSRIFFETVASPRQAALVMTTLKILSNHSDNEQYIADKEHSYIFDKAARAEHDNFLDALKRAEATMEARNKNSKSRVRGANFGVEGPLPYTLLMPTSGEGVTMRGVPNSISI